MSQPGQTRYRGRAGVRAAVRTRWHDGPPARKNTNALAKSAFEATVCGGQQVLVTMTKGPVLTGRLVGSTQRAGVRVANEKGERIGNVWGEITLQSLEGDELTLDAVDVASIKLARK